MKFLSKITALFLLGFIAFSACKKDKTVIRAEDTIATKDYVYNLAKKTLTPDASILAVISSDIAIKYIYSYLLRDGKGDSLVNIAYPTAEEQNSYTLNIAATAFDETDMTNVTGIKNVTKRVDNSSSETFIKLSSFQPPLPVLSGFPASKLPDDHDEILITGTATSVSGLSKVEILDDSQGDFSVVTTLDNLNGASSYDVNYTYTYRANTANLKVIAYDIYDIKVETVISVPALPYVLYKDVVMGAQGTSSTTVTNNHFFIADGTTAGSCTLLADETNLDFLYYSTSSGPSLYSPTNATNVAKNFYCDGTKDFWNTSTTDFTKLKPTRFRVMVLGDAGVDDLYAKFEANDIADLDDDGLFAGISPPSSSTAKYVPDATPKTSQYDISTAYLIWIKVPTTPDATAYKNCLMRVKEASDAGGTSTIKFDIYVQK